MSTTTHDDRDLYAEGWEAGVAQALAQVARRRDMPARDAATSVALDVARGELAGLPTSWNGMGLGLRAGRRQQR